MYMLHTHRPLLVHRCPGCQQHPYYRIVAPITCGVQWRTTVILHGVKCNILWVNLR